MMIAASYNIVFLRNVNAIRLQVQRKNVVNNKLRLPKYLSRGIANPAEMQFTAIIIAVYWFGNGKVGSTLVVSSNIVVL